MDWNKKINHSMCEKCYYDDTEDWNHCAAAYTAQDFKDPNFVPRWCPYLFEHAITRAKKDAKH